MKKFLSPFRIPFFFDTLRCFGSYSVTLFLINTFNNHLKPFKKDCSGCNFLTSKSGYLKHGVTNWKEIRSMPNT